MENITVTVPYILNQDHLIPTLIQCNCIREEKQDDVVVFHVEVKEPPAWMDPSSFDIKWIKQQGINVALLSHVGAQNVYTAVFVGVLNDRLRTFELNRKNG